MEERMPKPGELYLHFKNKLYQIIAVATHSETGEKMVVYQALYGDFQVYVRPLEMFVSKVDKVKYPDVTQYYRFQKVTREEVAERNNVDQVTDNEKAGADYEEREEEASQEELANPYLLKFLDADTFDEKYRLLLDMKSEMTDRLINDLAVVLDVVIPEGDLDERYSQLKSCVETFRKFETTRFR